MDTAAAEPVLRDALPHLPHPADPPALELAVEGRARLPEDGPEHLCWWDGEQVRTLALERGFTRIGRSLAADVRFDDATLSRRHALLVRHHDGVRVHDDGSRNGVFVNGRRTEHTALQDGDVIQVGGHQVVFLVPVQVPLIA